MKKSINHICLPILLALLYVTFLYGIYRPSMQSYDTVIKTNDVEDLQIYAEDLSIPIDEPSSTNSSLADNGLQKVKAVIVILVRNEELNAMRKTIRQFEDRFNRKYNYPYVFLNDQPFTEEFKESIDRLTQADTKYGLIPKQMWSIPDHIDETVLYNQLDDYRRRNILYGGSLSYRHMCRFNSGFFYHHPLLDEYDYYWRVEPGVSFFCDMAYDPFEYMQENKKEYGFTIALREIPETVPTLWKHTLDFARLHKLNTTLLSFFGDQIGGYNLCHYWSNFEIASLNLWRGEKYQAYFDYLDATGNFFYERWGDAAVHSLAVGMFLNKDQVHFFRDIGYQHDNFAHCVDDGIFGHCMCPDSPANFDSNRGSCLPHWMIYPDEGVMWNFGTDEE